MILIVDFGSQTTHLISRRLKSLGAGTKIVHPEDALFEITANKPDGLILSGGPSSVYSPNAPTIDPKVFEFNLPTLGICYGLQLISQLLGGKVISGKKEYGPAELKIVNKNMEITKDLPENFTVWMSHGDEITKLPPGFEILGTTNHMPFAFVENKTRKMIGVQFHPEVDHTDYGNNLLEKFILFTKTKTTPYKLNTDQMIADIKTQVGESYVIGAVSGGVDSTVAASLTAKAIGDKFIPVYVDNGLMRDGTTQWVKKIFKQIGIKPIILEVEGEMLKRLKGISDPEAKRKLIGAYYIELFELEMTKAQKAGKNVSHLLQGTIYSDVIESQGTKHASKIKSHHNVGGLPEKMKLKLLEPLRNFYKDEAREIGAKLGLPKDFIWKQVFPGPGYGVRIRGEVTKERLEKIKQADKIILEELEKAKLLDKVYMSFPIMTGASSTAVKGDERFFGEVIALRLIESKDVMTAEFAQVPYSLLQTISSRIVNEVPQISRVVYDITTKPPATMEWE